MTTTTPQSIIEETGWKNFQFRFLTLTDIPTLSKHLENNFYPDEPLCIILGTSDLHNKEMEHSSFRAIPQNLSFAAYDMVTNKLAAFCIISRGSKRPKEDASASVSALAPKKSIFESHELQIICNLLDPVDAACDICELYGVTEYANLTLVSTDRQFRGQGLATELFRRAFHFLKESGFSVCRTCFTNPISRHIGQKLGYREHGYGYFRDMKNLQGQPICPQAGDEECAVVAAVQL